jgi:hemerythrin
MREFSWSDEYLLGYGAMDETHREFVTIVNDLLQCDDSAVEGYLQAFARHAEAHFKEEDGWMERSGFPPRECHVDEHAAVLKSVYQVLEIVKAGDFAEGRRLAAALADWFPGACVPPRFGAGAMDGQAKPRRQAGGDPAQRRAAGEGLIRPIRRWQYFARKASIYAAILEKMAVLPLMSPDPTTRNTAAQ